MGAVNPRGEMEAARVAGLSVGARSGPLGVEHARQSGASLSFLHL
jgi:hypothetical protein